MKKRVMMSVFGVFLCAVSVAFFKYAAFGMDSIIHLIWEFPLMMQ